MAPPYYFLKVCLSFPSNPTIRVPDPACLVQPFVTPCRLLQVYFDIIFIPFSISYPDPDFQMVSRSFLVRVLHWATSGAAAFWMDEIGHLGISPYHPDGVNYQVFRNVRNFGAVGDGGSSSVSYLRALV